MPKHHFLPAAFLGSFSKDKKTPRRRQRRLWVGDLSEQRIFEARAADIGAIKNLYTLIDEDQNPQLIDQIWADYEKSLPEAIHSLVEGNISTSTWLRVLVPFVACLLVRGPDFSKRYSRRMESLSFGQDEDILSPDNTNLARAFELQRLLGQVTAYKWIVGTVDGRTDLITTDLGYAIFLNPLTNDYGIAVPIAPRHILHLIPRTSGIILNKDGEDFRPAIQYVSNGKDNHVRLNEVLTQMASRWIYGGDEEEIERLVRTKRVSFLYSPEPQEFGFMDSRYARAFEFTWHTLVSSYENYTKTNSIEYKLDWNAVAKGWCPPVWFPTNLVQFPTPLNLVNGDVGFETYDPEVYYEISQLLFLLKTGDFEEAIDRSTKALDRNGETKFQLLAIRAEAYQETGQLNLAEADFKQSLKGNTEDPNALINYGDLLAEQSRSEEAKELFTKAIAAHPEFGLGYLNRGNLLAQQGLIEQALNDIRKAEDLLPPGNRRAEAFLSRGMILGLQGETDRAIDYLSQALSTLTDRNRKSIALGYRSQAFLEKKLPANAIRDAKNSINLMPQNPVPYFVLAESMRRNQNTDQQIEVLSQLLQQDIEESSKAQAYILKASAHLHQSDFESARSDLEAAHAIDPSELLAQKQLGFLNMAEGKLSEALTHYQQAEKADPHDPKTSHNIGIALLALGRLDEAIAAFKKALEYPEIEEHEDRVGILRNLSSAYALNGDTLKARETMSTVEEQEPDAMNTQIVLGRIALLEGKIEESLAIHANLANALKQENQQNPYLAFPFLLSGEEDQGIEIIRKLIKSESHALTIRMMAIDALILYQNHPENKSLLRAREILEAQHSSD